MERQRRAIGTMKYPVRRLRVFDSGLAGERQRASHPGFVPGKQSPITKTLAGTLGVATTGARQTTISRAVKTGIHRSRWAVELDSNIQASLLFRLLVLKPFDEVTEQSLDDLDVVRQQIEQIVALDGQ